jgi:hypothetical protein
VRRHSKVTVRQGHVNQLFAYVQNVAGADGRQRPTNGIILYAGVSGAFLQDLDTTSESRRSTYQKTGGTSTTASYRFIGLN